MRHRTTEKGKARYRDKASFKRRVLGLVVIVSVVMALVAAAPANAAPPTLWQAPPNAKTGSAAGQFEIPRGIAVAPASAPNKGHVFVVDQENNRVTELTAWGVFVKAWGWDVVQSGPGDDTSAPEDQFEICAPADGDVCRRGQIGSSPGQFGFAPQGIAVDSAGSIYVADGGNKRVQKFGPAGNFVLTFGGEVNKTKVEEGAPEAQRNLCIAASGDVCQAGTQGAGNGQFGAWPIVGSYIAITSGDKVYVGDVGRIQEFNTSGEYQAQVTAGIAPAEKVKSLAVGPTGILYAAIENQNNVRRWNPAHESISSIAVSAPQALAVDSDQSLYAISDILSPLIRKFNSSGNEVESWGQEEPPSPKLDGADLPLTGLAASSACLSDGTDVYVSSFGQVGVNSFVRAYGPPPDPDLCEPPPLVPPAIEDQYAVSVGADNARVRALINPQFWDDTTYYVEYGTGECASGGCEERAPLDSELPLGGGVTNAAQAAAASLTGLQAETTYHYRFVAESTGGGPVFGSEATFTTFPPPPTPKTGCPNQAFRTGPSAFLPNCRAFEMVSPTDKNGDGIDALIALGGTDVKAAHDQSAGAGDGITYSSKQVFGDAVGGGYSSQYLSRRDAMMGWSTHPLNAPRESFTSLEATTLDSEYKAFAEDLAEAWMIHGANPPLAPCAPLDSTVLYRRDNDTDAYEALHCEPNVPAFFQARDTIELQGVSADGCHTVFRSRGQLTADAVGPVEEVVPLKQPYQLYESSCKGPGSPEGPLRLVSRLPNGSACQKEGATLVDATVGGAPFGPPFDPRDGRAKRVWHAFSADAHRLYWSCGATLYLRTDPDLSLEGDETVVQIAKSSCEAPGVCAPPRFQSASADGGKMLFTALSAGGYELRSYDAQSNTASAIAKRLGSQALARDLLGASEDGTRAYFTSTEVCSGGLANSEGDVAVAGQPNLYLYEEGETCTAGDLTFIGTLSASDDLRTATTERSPVYPAPYYRTSRVSPDGLHAVFTSSARLTGFNNTDIENGKADAEVFVFDATANGGAGKLLCISCNPSGVRPRGRNLATPPETYWAAAWIPGWQSQLYQGRPLSEDGRRLFFNSFEALVDRDTNNRMDVYEWEQVDSEGAQGKAQCKEMGAEAFVQSASGCLSLISSGQDPEDSEFIDADKDGSDVFIRTGESLLSQDPGLIDVYDVRVNGGFPEPGAPEPGCEGEACQSPPGAPEFSTPASSAFRGPEGSATKPRPRCRKGKVRRGKRCVARKHKSSKRANRRTAR